MKSEELRRLLNEPSSPGFEYIENYRSYENEIINGYTMETVKYNMPLDNHCPAKMGQLTAIIGHTNVGKTTFLLWLMSLLMKSGRKVLIYSAENRISSLHKQIARFYTGYEHIGIEHLQQVREHTRYIKHERHFSYKDLLNQSTFLLDAGFEWDFFLIDPYNALKIENKDKLNMHDYHYQAVEEMRIFTMTTNKSIFLNCHTVTESQREKPDANGETPVPMMSMVEGGGKFPNKCDDVIVLHRHIHSNNDSNRYITEIHVGKVRNQEFGGKPTKWGEPLKARYRYERTGFDIILQPKEEPKEIKNMDFFESKAPF
jgi:energy-coupling factor transporter ATP-binding protein EcfA2